MSGYLQIHRSNPRYFDDGSGRAILLAGSHHWDSVVDNAERASPLDFAGFIDRLVGWGHNFTRLWCLEAWVHDVTPSPWMRTGPGRALDGGLRFDLSRFDHSYFERLAWRLDRLAERQIFASTMLFNGWSLRDNGDGNPWPRHPFHRDNNINGIDGDPHQTGCGDLLHTLRLADAVRLQELYVERVVAVVARRANVLWEISNESPGASAPWQEHFVERLRRHHGVPQPVGVTACFPGGRNKTLFASTADWISPARRGGYMKSPPAADGSKVILLDTDHLWGIGGGRDWVWKTFLRGMHPIYMDPLDDQRERREARAAMGHALRFAARLSLAHCEPANDLSSTGYCLANRDHEQEQLLAYSPRGHTRMDLRSFSGEFDLEWFDPSSGASLPGGRVSATRRVRLEPPFPGDAVLFLQRPRPAEGTS